MRWQHVAIAVCVVLALGAAWLIVREAGGQANRLADRVLPARDGEREVVRTFREYLASVRAAKGDQLLVAEVRTVNEVAISDTRREFWTGLSLGTSTASIRYPVTYRYYVSLSDGWRLARDGGTLWLRRPTLRPLEPAIDTAGIECRGENGWLRWNREELKDRLIAELTPDATVRAREHAATAAPHADAAVMAFVRAWFLSAAGVPADARVALCDEIPAGLAAVDVRMP